MVNWLPQVPETPQSGVSRGMAFFGDALDAVLDRRARMEAERLEREQRQAHALMVDARTREQMANTAEDQRLDRERLTAADAATAQHRAGELRLRQQEAMAAGIKEALPHFAAPGQETAGVAALQARGIRYTPWQPDQQLMQPAAPVTSQPDDPEGAWTGQSPADAQRQALLEEQVRRNRGTGKLTMGDGGPEVAFDMKSLGPEGAYERNLQALAAITNPADYAVARQIAAMGRAGMVDQNKTGGMVQDVTLQRLNAEDALERARLQAAAASKRRDEMAPKQKLDAARSDLSDYLTQRGYRADQVSGKQFTRMQEIAKAAASGNAMAARMFMGMYTKFAQGEVGVLTEGDMKVFWEAAGSPEARTEEVVEKVLSGGLGAKKQKDAIAAINTLAETVRARLDGTYKDAVGLMRPYGEDGDRRLRAMFGRGLPEYDKKNKAMKAGEADAFLDSLGAPK